MVPMIPLSRTRNCCRSGICRHNGRRCSGCPLLQDLVRRAGGNDQRQQAGNPEEGRADANDELLHGNISPVSTFKSSAAANSSTLQDLVRRPRGDDKRKEAGDPEKSRASASDQLLHHHGSLQRAEWRIFKADGRITGSCAVRRRQPRGTTGQQSRTGSGGRE